LEDTLPSQRIERKQTKIPLALVPQAKITLRPRDPMMMRLTPD
jgi:hypothetical protein